VTKALPDLGEVAEKNLVGPVLVSNSLQSRALEGGVPRTKTPLKG